MQGASVRGVGVIAAVVSALLRSRLRVVVLAAGMVLTCCSSCGGIEQRPDIGAEPGSIELCVTPERVRHALIAAFNGSNAARLPHPFRRFSAAMQGHEYFPRDDQIAVDASRVSELRNYLSLEKGKRAFDVYVYDFSDADLGESYWPSEYSVGDRSLPFRCDFLVHIASAPAGARVTIHELAARVWVGKKFAFEAHGPGIYLDVRPVPPTRTERRALLSLIQRLTADEARGCSDASR